jgi:hypothetical protein
VCFGCLRGQEVVALECMGSLQCSRQDCNEGEGTYDAYRINKQFFFAFRVCTCDRYNDVIELLH